MLDLSSQTRDWNCAPALEGDAQNTRSLKVQGGCFKSLIEEFTQKLKQKVNGHTLEVVNLQCLFAIISYIDRQYKVSIMRSKLEKTQTMKFGRMFSTRLFFPTPWVLSIYCWQPLYQEWRIEKILDAIKAKHKYRCGAPPNYVSKCGNHRGLGAECRFSSSAVSWLCCLKENHWTSQNLFPCIYGWDAKSILTDLWGRSLRAFGRHSKSQSATLNEGVMVLMADSLADFPGLGVRPVKS